MTKTPDISDAKMRFVPKFPISTVGWRVVGGGRQRGGGGGLEAMFAAPAASARDKRRPTPVL